jgi:hypothetical protein
MRDPLANHEEAPPQVRPNEFLAYFERMLKLGILRKLEETMKVTV